jgi:hypothetical protein
MNKKILTLGLLTCLFIFFAVKCRMGKFSGIYVPGLSTRNPIVSFHNASDHEISVSMINGIERRDYDLARNETQTTIFPTKEIIVVSNESQFSFTLSSVPPIPTNFIDYSLGGGHFWFKLDNKRKIYLLDIK